MEEKRKKISSTAIRKLLNEGYYQEAKSLLGRFYTTKGTVVHGEKRGRTIGFPTANIRINSDYIIPKPEYMLFESCSWKMGRGRL